MNFKEEASQALIEAAKEDPMAVVELFKRMVDVYKPAAYGILNELLGIYKDYANNTEFQETRARVFRNSYDAFVNVGFTADQAVAFIINDNLQLMKASKSLSKSTNKKENK